MEMLGFRIYILPFRFGEVMLIYGSCSTQTPSFPFRIKGLETILHWIIYLLMQKLGLIKPLIATNV